ncbi:uncharacterized protein JCM15063_005252 [Sporobolomyces koalae]|uniref:uncharacterized protein n=1 Tax=Sporobolomyces koalae TaxID=500713 RepID=UPI00317C76D7
MPETHANAVRKPAEPPALGPRELQVERAIARLRSIPNPLEKYTYLTGLRARNEDVYYGVIGAEPKEVMPIVYTPTIGLACQNFSLIHPPPIPAASTNDPIRNLYLTYDDLPNLPELIAGLKTRLDKEEMRICVVTDSSRILGIGDQGIGGMGISQGKLALYVAGAGVQPKSTLPVCLDLGTDNEALLSDPHYVGVRKRRVDDKSTLEFVDVFMREMHKNFPNMIIQFEDFATSKAFPILHKHRDVYPCFNDDIQGTGAVVLAGAIRAFHLNKVPLKDQRILFFGAGSSGVGVAETIVKYFQLQGMSEEEAKSKFWLVDSKGLVSHNRGDKLPEHKQYLARAESDAPRLPNLLEVLKHVKPTALLGLSTVGGSFTPEILSLMAEYNKRPIVFALSNPVSQAECTFEEAIESTNGSVLFASGSPFDKVEFNQKVYEPGQGNNLYIFPALGLGAILARVKTIPEEMVHASAQGLADSLTAAETERNLLYPDVERIREVSITIALKVIRSAQKLGVDRNEELRSMSDRELEEYVRQQMYHPLLA